MLETEIKSLNKEIKSVERDEDMLRSRQVSLEQREEDLEKVRGHEGWGLEAGEHHEVKMVPLQTH